LAECEHALEIDIAKNRDGTTGTVSLFCDTACNAVRELETVRIP
jgi:replicative DNA helicase